MKYNRLFLPFLLFFSTSLFAQKIFLRSGAVEPPANISREAVDSFNAGARRFGGQAFAVIQFYRIPTAAEQKRLQDAGITLLDYLPQHAYTVSIRGNVSTEALQGASAKALFSLQSQQKMQALFAEGRIPYWAVKVAGTVDVLITFPKTLEAADVMAQLKTLNVEILSDEHKNYGVLLLRIADGRVAEIAALPFVEYIQPAPPKDQPLNYNSRVGSRATVLNAAVADGGKGLNGEGVVMGVGDNADVQTHVDFSGRLINRNASAVSAHGTHTTGTAAGAGNIDERYRGYAPKATVISQAFSGIVDNAAAYVNDYGMVLTNNSYGNIIECEYHGTYDVYSRIVDQQMLDHPSLLHVFSSGNSGLDVCAPFPQSFHTVLGGYQSAKNVVTVGATTDSGAVGLFSSKGPVKDGRLKPEVTAMGIAVTSAWPTNGYLGTSGTSMASPAVTGGLALLYQRYRQLNGGANPKNALMKALVCNGAADRGTPGPDFQNGFGWLHLLRSVEALEAARYFSGNSTNGGLTTHTVTVPANTAQLKVLLYWNDLPASLISTKTLVNDLDLEVGTPSSGTVLPRILDTLTANLNNAAVTGADHVNNVEQVIINNPAAGNYTVTVKGSTVTNGQQEYFVVYDAVPAGLKVTAPAGGQALVPGELTKISWDAYGLTGTATLEFSHDGGATWSVINAAVDVNRVVYTWTVPAVATHNALVRITRNGTGETGVSTSFTIVGQPVVNLSPVQCEGYVSLNWTPVAGAAGYEVMLLRGDDMKPIAATTATSYTFGGLSKDSVYWVSVRARINGRAGRRAIAVSRQPNGGTCAGSISDNDLKLEAVVTPTSGRLFTATQLSAAQPVTVRIKNLDDVAQNNFTVSYAFNGVWVTETVNTPLAAGGTLDYTFAATANLAAPGSYNLKAAVRNAADLVTANDTLTVVVKQIDNQPLNLSSLFVDNFETAVPATYAKDTVGLAGIERYDFNRSTGFGRARTFVNSDIAFSGTKALTLDADRLTTAGNISYLLGTYNLGNYTAATADLRLDFQYLHHGQLPNAANRVWIRGSDTQPWIEAFRLDSGEHDAGTYKRSVSIELSNLLAAAGQNFTPGFGVRWGQWGQFQATDKQSAAGYTFDDVRLYQVFNDVQLVKVDSPAVNSCGLSATTRLKITVRNASNAALTNVPVAYRVNGGTPVTETVASIPPRTTVQYTFAAAPDFSQPGANLLRVYTAYAPDSFKENDSASVTVYNQPVVNTYPYLQTFENGDGYFYAGGKRSSWEYGTPASNKIRGAASGAKAWKTRLTGTYNDNELSYLYSPCFDVSGLAAPTLSFSVALDIEDCGNQLCDGAWVEYSADGITWTKLGTTGTGTNWYNKTGNPLWSVQNYAYWHVATQPLPTGLSRLRLRFVFSSDPGVARDGIAIDDVHLYDNTKGIYDGPTLAAPVTQNVGGNNWVDFTANGKLVASVQAGNASLGNTDVQAYINSGATRFTTSQYYHNRNLTVKPANASLPDSVRVRFYFLDSETEALLKATGCAGCAKPESAYALGVSKYTDANKAVENGTIADNTSGLWQFIPPAAVAKVPFDKGYYAEFKTAGFSEFWLNNGGLAGSSSLPVKLLDFTATKQGTNVLLKWTTGSEADVVRYELELARGDDGLAANRFEKIGEVPGAGNTASSRQYVFTDSEADKFGARYYRLKIVNASGSFSYSDVRAVLFADAVLWQVYPNPSTGRFSLVYRLNPDETVKASLYDAKGSLVREYRSRANGFLQKLSVDVSANNYASGVYLLKVDAGGEVRTFKLYKRES